MTLQGRAQELAGRAGGRGPSASAWRDLRRNGRSDGEIWEEEVNRSSREYVKWVQSGLNRLLGLSLAVDGMIGARTRSAIRSFQSRFALTVDGKVGPQTEAMLTMLTATPPPGSGGGSSPAPPRPSGGLPYAVVAGREYGGKWRGQRPPGLPASARPASAAGAALDAVRRAARAQGLGETFVAVVSHLAQTESGATYALPANIFDARPPSQRPEGKSLITAWGVFQFNRDAWRALPGVASTAFPWNATPAEEVDRPVARYAALFREVRSAGGSDLAAARGIRLWHRSPAAYRSYLRTGRSSGFDAAWRGVPQSHRSAVDRRMQQIGLTAAGQDELEALFAELDGELEMGGQATSLSGSVGSGGKNASADVRKVQTLLNRFIAAGAVPGTRPLVIDGKIGPKTIAAIKAFQKAVAGMKYPDGRVDPGGRTLRALDGPVTPRPVTPPPPVPQPSTGNLKHGVPNGVIFSGYLKLRSGGYHTGIDVWPSVGGDKGANDPRRGQPVYATVRTSIDLATLNSTTVAPKKEPPRKKGLGIPGQGVATLREAEVLIVPKKNRTGMEYGGVVGLACRYTYKKTDGSAGVFTLFVEYWHLITPDYLPKLPSGKVLSLQEWQATGKGDRIGFGPRMQNGAVLKPSDFAVTPPLVGYLGATQTPHVHIHANYAAGVKGRLFYPRLDPTVVVW